MRRALAALALCLPLVAHGGSVELSQGVEALSGGRPAWRATVVDSLWTGERGAAAGFAVRELSRFGQNDTELAASS